MPTSWILDEGAGRLPGVRIGIVRSRAPRREDRTVAAFVGFGDDIRPSRRHEKDAAMADLGISCRRFADFQVAVRPDPRGYLGAAVRGFFVNGGEECVVYLLSPRRGVASDEAARALRVEDARRLLDPGGALEDRDDIGLLCVPDVVSAELVGEAFRTELQQRQVRHCELSGERFAILDVPAPAASDAHAAPAVPDALRSSFAAMYTPWVVPDRWGDERHEARAMAARWRRPAPAAESPGVAGAMPPSGHVAGLYARADGRHGAHRAPANMLLFGTRELSREASLDEAQRLNDDHVNCIAHVPGVGICVTGARTLSFHEHSPFVSTKRVVIDLRRWIAWGLADLVFEPVSPGLQARLRDRLVLHCTRLWESGEIVGRTPEEAFRVKCDAENNTAPVCNTGTLVAEVGIAPSVPAEFIDVRIVRDAYGFAVTGQ